MLLNEAESDGAEYGEVSRRTIVRGWRNGTDNESPKAMRTGRERIPLDSGRTIAGRMAVRRSMFAEGRGWGGGCCGGDKGVDVGGAGRFSLPETGRGVLVPFDQWSRCYFPDKLKLWWMGAWDGWETKSESEKRRAEVTPMMSSIAPNSGRLFFHPTRLSCPASPDNCGFV